MRLGLCNLNCSWCDTPYTWDWTGQNGPPQDKKALTRRTAEDITVEVVAMDPDLVVITGGEPMVQQTALAPLVANLFDLSLPIEVETNGTIIPKHPEFDWVAFNVSPKLSSSGCDPTIALNPEALAWYAEEGHTFKFVIANETDLRDAMDLVAAVEIPPENVWVMPEGRDSETILGGLRWLAPRILDLGWNLSSRLHVLIWEDERAR